MLIMLQTYSKFSHFWLWALHHYLHFNYQFPLCLQISSINLLPDTIIILSDWSSLSPLSKDSNILASASVTCHKSQIYTSLEPPQQKWVLYIFVSSIPPHMQIFVEGLNDLTSQNSDSIKHHFCQLTGLQEKQAKHNKNRQTSHT